MCKIEKCVIIEKSGRGRPGRGVVLEIRTHPDKGRGWFENPRFWRTSFVDGPKLTKYKNPTFDSKMLVININEHTCTFFHPNKLINLEMIQFIGRPGIHQGPRNDIFVFVLHMPSFELDFDEQKCTNLYIFNKTRIAGKRLRRMSYKLARWFIMSAWTYIPK